MMEHGWDKEWLEDAMERMEQGATAKEALEPVEQIDWIIKGLNKGAPVIFTGC